METGTTFLVADKTLEKHLWVVLSDPQQFPDQVVIVSFTTADAEAEKTCVVQRHEHAAWLTHESCIAYEFAQVVTLKLLLDWKDGGHIQVQPDKVSGELLNRIRQKAGDSPHLPDRAADALLAQGLIVLTD